MIFEGFFVWIYALYLVFMSFVTFVMYGVDKRKAKKGQWRISEKTLLISGFVGGAAGALIGMKLFRHKTRHWYFWAINIVGLCWQIALLIFISAIGWWYL
ncbi:MAG: DUF1294 domain-containing protein [Oscillospiraceae bacterium]|nr:DUF1294 domain-containing protein [Oscillospiraceae bacterium]